MRNTILPYNIQFFAEEEGAAEEVQPIEKEPEQNDTPDEKQTIEQLKKEAKRMEAELAAEKAARAKEKAALDKALKEKGDITKQLRAKQTSEELEAEEKAERERLQAEELEKARKELNHMKAIAAYKDIDDENVVERLIAAVGLDADHAEIASVISLERKKQKAIDDAEFKKSRPQLNIGEGGTPTMTKDEIMAIKDPIERQRAIASNLSLFERKGE